MRVFILVPVYNEWSVFPDWLSGLIRLADEIKAEVLVVDDGSNKPLKSCDFSHVTLLSHEVNCGVGAAIETGFQFAREHLADIVLTIDGDGQHDPKDLKALLSELQRGDIDIVNGTRFLWHQSIPYFRRLANFFANILIFFLSGYYLTDSQSGMKGFTKKALSQIRIHSSGYEWCSDVFREASWYGLRVSEIPVSVSYNSYTMRKGQGIAAGLDIVMRLIVRSLVK